MECKICCLKEADKKGSHIIPHFLLKRVDNADNSKERDKELGFVLSEYNPKSYFGRAVLPEKIEEVHGEITDELISQNHIPLIEDNIFCSDCEKKLGVLESEYAKTIGKSSAINANYSSGVDSFLGFLFWSSVIWRLSISKNSGFSLHHNDEKRLQRILSKYLNIDITQLSPKLNDPDLTKIGYKILRASQYSDYNSTLVFCHPNFQRPYYFFIDEFILVFYFRMHYVNKPHEKFLNLPQILSHTYFNTVVGDEIIKSIPHEVIDLSKEYFYNELSKRFLGNFSYHLDIIHTKLGGKGKMSAEIKEEIVQTMIRDDSVSMGEKYSVKHKTKAIFSVLNRYN